MIYKILFFGSTSDSVIVLEKLYNLQPFASACDKPTTFNLRLASVVTQPPRPVGRDKMLMATPVELWAHGHHIPVLTFPTNHDKPWLYEDDQTVIDTLEPFKADLLVSACYGQKIPAGIISKTRLGGINIHPSLLPRWRGADPVPWAILTGDHQTGVTVVTLAERFDQGTIIAKKKIPISDRDTSDALRTKLFSIGSNLLVDTFPSLLAAKSKTTFKGATLQGDIKPNHPYARRFTRDDGFLPWTLIQQALRQETGDKRQVNEETTKQSALPAGVQFACWRNKVAIVKDYIKYANTSDQDKPISVIFERFFRALHPWPGIWTLINPTNVTNTTNKQIRRLKILSCHLSPATCLLSLDIVQLEGKNPMDFAQFIRAYPMVLDN